MSQDGRGRSEQAAGDAEPETPPLPMALKGSRTAANVEDSALGVPIRATTRRTAGTRRGSIRAVRMRRRVRTSANPGARPPVLEVVAPPRQPSGEFARPAERAASCCHLGARAQARCSSPSGRPATCRQRWRRESPCPGLPSRAGPRRRRSPMCRDPATPT